VPWRTAHDKAYHSLELFLAAYGAFAGDMALACLARGGVFLAGGIVAKLMPLLPHSPFLDSFQCQSRACKHCGQDADPCRHRPLLGLRGALCLAGEEKPLPG
jgi:glucokinase